VRLFDAAAEEYDAARPSYPPGVYDVLESRTHGLAGKVVADGGAGTGIVARQLLDRGADVVAFDPGPGVLRQAIARTPGLPAVIADAAAVPLRSGGLDMVCFGQSWHWVDQAAGAREMSRLLRSRGWWAAWWNHAWADGEDWFDEYNDLLETTCPPFSRHLREVDRCAAAMAAQSAFSRPERHILPWERRVTIEDWLTDLRSHSYVLDLGESRREQLVATAGSILSRHFRDGNMTVAYQTRLWMACRT
jgi:ubiquinone/menaquinone biosynthesis C-methylase UbiE